MLRVAQRSEILPLPQQIQRGLALRWATVSLDPESWATSWVKEGGCHSCGLETVGSEERISNRQRIFLRPGNLMEFVLLCCQFVLDQQPFYLFNILSFGMGMSILCLSLRCILERHHLFSRFYKSTNREEVFLNCTIPKISFVLDLYYLEGKV